MLSEQKIVIIGGGFAGVNLANRLANKKGFNVTLIDKNNYNFFPPLLYQVATAFLEVSSISYPFRKLFQKKKNIHFRLGELVEVVFEENKILLNNGEVFYDYLVIATGAETNYFGSRNIKKNALPMKTIDDALDIRNYLLLMLEEATIATSEYEKQKLSNIVIAGGGPTGVEVAGMLAEMKNRLLKKEYPEVVARKLNIYLVTGAAELLSPMSVSSQKDTYEALTKLGVTIMLKTTVTDYEDDTVIFNSSEPIITKTLIWAAGVIPKIIKGFPSESYGRGNRLIVDGFNKVQSFNNIYAIGDACIQTNEVKYPKGHPQVASVAIQHGKNLAKNLKSKLENKPQKAFIYFDKGSMAIIGKNKAVLDFPRPKIHIKGFIAFMAWIFIHLLELVNYRNILKTFYNWIGAYLTSDQAFRMIVRPSAKIMNKKKIEAVEAAVS